MKSVLPLVAVAILLLGVVGVFGVIQANQQALARARAEAAATPTVGEFVLRYARAMRLADGDSTPAQALQSLRAVGVIDSGALDLTAGLTEGDVVRIAASMELGVATRHLERAFSRAQTDTFFAVFAPALERHHPGDAGRLLRIAGQAAEARDTAHTSAHSDRTLNTSDLR